MQSVCICQHNFVFVLDRPLAKFLLLSVFPLGRFNHRSALVTAVIEVASEEHVMWTIALVTYVERWESSSL